MIGLLVFAVRSQGLAAAPAVAILLFILPIASWILVAKLRPATRLLWFYTNLPRRAGKGYYFETTPKPVHGVERRTFELFLPVLGMSAYFASQLTTIIGFEKTIALNIFIGLSIAVLGLSSLFLITIWVYEDSGFRAHSAGSTTLGIPLRLVKGFLIYGGLGAYITLSSKLAGSVSGAASFTLTALLIFWPLCYLITTLFHHITAKKAIDEVRRLGTSKGLPLKSMSVT